jgi:hypothetical protein
MRVSTEDVTAAFLDLLSGARSREDVANWAHRVRVADDAEGIRYDPPAAESAIWDALEFLIGVDLKDGPDSYLHNQQDFEEYWSSKKGDLMR